MTDAAGELRAVLAGIYPDWRAWHDKAGWHARRAGSFMVSFSSDGVVSYVTSRRPDVLTVLIGVAARWRPERWDAPVRAAQPLPLEHLAPFLAAARCDPGELARALAPAMRPPL